MKRILFIEDDHSYRSLLKDQLIKSGFEVDAFDNPVKGLEMVAVNKYDLVISDLMLPIMSGVMFTEAVKNIDPNMLCIILTGSPDDDLELIAIKNNIDLYIEKTKTFPVILEYINRLLKENKKVEVKEVNLYSKHENIFMDVDAHEVYKDEVLVELTPIEYEILKLLLKNKNQVISRDDFIEKVWQESIDEVSPRIVDSHVKRLRDKIRAFSIMTVRGYGYKWNELEE